LSGFRDPIDFVRAYLLTAGHMGQQDRRHQLRNEVVVAIVKAADTSTVEVVGPVAIGDTGYTVRDGLRIALAGQLD
jgi:hypothetical protein